MSKIFPPLSISTEQDLLSRIAHLKIMITEQILDLTKARLDLLKVEQRLRELQRKKTLKLVRTK